MKIILPKTLIDLDPHEGPLFFLAGPIGGGGDWQRRCCLELQKRLSKFYVAVPNLWEEGHELWAHRVDGKPDTFLYRTRWERYWLERAARLGCILFWLPCEQKEVVSPSASKTYARDTRGELGEWRGRMMHDPSIRLVIGGEKDFDGLSVIKWNFSEALGYEFLISSSLGETVDAAIAKLT